MAHSNLNVCLQVHLLIILALHITIYASGESNHSLLVGEHGILEGDKECVGDRAEALEVGRQCSRRCRKDVPCENTRKHCLCDGLCGMSCIKPDLNCPELPNIENGNYYPKSTLFNNAVVYQCNAGYYLYGSRERLCQGDEEWSGIPAECSIERKLLFLIKSMTVA